MPLNFGYVGIGKQAGTSPVAPTAFFRATAPAQVRAEMAPFEVPNISGYGVAAVAPQARSAVAQFEALVQPVSIGHLLAALLGAPSTTGTGPYTHTFTPKTAFPSYTVEAQDGAGVHRVVGAQATELEFSHSADGALLVNASLAGLDRTVGGTAATATYETAFYTAGNAAVSVGGTALEARAPSVRLTLSFPKTARRVVGSLPATAIDPTGEADVTAEVELIADAADQARLTTFLNAGTFPVSIAWANAGTSLTFAFTAYLTDDPVAIQNRDTGMARIRLALRAVSGGAPLLTVTLVNGHSGY